MEHSKCNCNGDFEFRQNEIFVQCNFCKGARPIYLPNTQWQLDPNANVTDEKREDINDYLNSTINKPIRVISGPIKFIYGSCPKEDL